MNEIVKCFSLIETASEIPSDYTEDSRTNYYIKYSQYKELETELQNARYQAIVDAVEEFEKTHDTHHSYMGNPPIGKSWLIKYAEQQKKGK